MSFTPTSRATATATGTPAPHGRRGVRPSHHVVAWLVPAVVLLGCGDGADAPDPPAPAPAPTAGGAPAPGPGPGPASAAGSAPGSAPGSAGTFAFRELGPETGLDVVMSCGGMPTREILEVNGGGVALLDYDDDGDLDVFVATGATLDDPTGGPGCRLFRNDGDMRFTDVTAAAGITTRGWCFGVAVGDADGDGWDDLFIARHGPNVLLRNRGDGTFEDVTVAAGLGDDRWATAAAFGDLDDDGDLDLFVVNYLSFDPASPPARATFVGQDVMGGPRGLLAHADIVHENLGDGRFVDRTDDWGVRPRADGYGLNLVIVDLDGDGTREVVVGNDSNPNHVWRRDDGTSPSASTSAPDADRPRTRFIDVGLDTGLATNGDGSPQATMGYAVADVNDDGHPDLFSTNFSSDTNTLHLSTGDDYHVDATRRYGLGIVSRPFLGWACWFADWDHDGDEDLLSFNGHVYPEATPELMDTTWRQPPLLFAREGARFARVDPPSQDHWLATPRLDRAAAFGDLDRDGDVDVVVAELNGPVRILESLAADRAAATGHPGTGPGMVIALRDQRPGAANHRGLGAELTISREGAEPFVRRRWLFTGGGFQSSSAPELHVALPGDGSGSGSVPVRIDVRWPDGERQTVTVAEPRPYVVVRRTD